MAMSGIQVDAAISTIFNSIKLKKGPKFIAFRLSKDMKRVIIDDEMVGEKATTTNTEDDKIWFQKMKDLLKTDAPRYIIYDFGFKQEDGKLNEKLAFIYWCSDNAPIKQKMTYASTKDSVLKVCKGVSKDFQIMEIQEIDYDVLRKAMENVR